MGIFAKKIAYADLQDRYRALALDMKALQSEMRKLTLEQVETYDKVKRLMSRVAKRAALDNPPDVREPDDVQDEFSHLDTVSAEIMRRRANGMK